MERSTERRSVFLLSLGVAAGLHGAALAYALAVHEPAASERVEEVVTVELVDPSLMPDESEPSPPTDKLPSAAASGAQQVASFEPAPARGTGSPDEAARQAVAPDLGEAEDGQSPEASANFPPEAAQAPASAAEVPAGSVPTSSTSSVLQAGPQSPDAVEAVAPAPLVSPPHASIVMEAPLEEEASFTVSPPMASVAPDEAPPPEIRPTDAPVTKATKPARAHPPVAKRPTVKRLASLETVKSIEPAAAKAKLKRRAEAMVETAAKPKARKLAALPTEGTDDASPGKAKAKPKAASVGKVKGKGASGTTASGSAGIGSYTNTVRARVARNKPSGTTGRGTAVVQVAVSGSGGIRFVRLKRSSGNAGLDRAAISAVQRAAPFPAPPSGATSAQLVINIPITYH